jgi:amino acid adenylation domain-containing protein
MHPLKFKPEFDKDIQDLAPEVFWKIFLKEFSSSSLLEINLNHFSCETDSKKYQKFDVNLRKISTSIYTFIKDHDLNISSVFQGTMAILLSHFSGNEDITFGFQFFSNEDELEFRLANNVIPMRLQIDQNTLLIPWLKDIQVQQQVLHKYLPVSLNQIQKWAEVDSETPLFENLLIINESGSKTSEIPSYPFAVVVTTNPELTLQIQYDCNKFQDALVAQFLDSLQVFLENMVGNSDQSLFDILVLTTTKRHQILVEWNNTQVDYPSDRTIHQIFEEQVSQTPDKVAVVLPCIELGIETQLSYLELNNRANILAQKLRHLGICAETPVAMCMERSIETIVAILGILKAGGIYVPLDPAYPQERLIFMLEDTQAPVLLTQSSFRDRLSSYKSQVIYLDANWGEGLPVEPTPADPISKAEGLAYINYTSGSTGRPKGVAIPHRAVARLVFGTNFTDLDGRQTLLQLAPVSFDAATLEIWGALLHGGCCILFPGDGIPDPKDLGTIIDKYGVTTLWLTAALFNTIIAEAPEALSGVQELLTGGEALSPTFIRLAQERLPNTQLINGYGPTENTTFTCCYRIPRPLADHVTSIPIGTPIANTQVYILNAYGQPVPVGVIGELYVGGDGLAREYINRPDLTAEKFIPNPFGSDPAKRLYKTGDRVRWLPDGNIEFVERLDNQVKIRGYRIELGEIETALSQHETVRDAVVLVREDIPGSKQLVAYVTAKAKQSPCVEPLKTYLQERLAEYMIPAKIVILDKIPLTPNGKVDRRALPAPVKEASDNFIAPKTSHEQALAAIWRSVLGLEQVGIEENFFDLGGTSLLGLRMVARVQKELGSSLRAVKLYQYPTIRTLAQYLDREDRQQSDRPQLEKQRRSLHLQESIEIQKSQTPALDGIAIIGMVGRFPGADSVEALWSNLCEGIESCTLFSEDEIDPSIDSELRNDPNYVRARGIIDGAETFDAAFFGISPREAEVMDPQARVFLELAYTALENSGYTPESYQGEIGLYAGSGQNTYFEHHVSGRPEIIDRLGAFQTMLANEKDFVTTRTSYKLGLTGPSLSINTACSTSLIAVIQAFQGLMNGDCDVALAGGISITTPQNRGYLYQEGSMLSPDGRCRPFDANAQGTLFNSGAGIVVLKRLEEAIDDGDRIYAVIRGIGMNNDGADKVSFTAPSVNGQAGAIAKAHAHAGIDPETITYIETHGTATPLGDPIEIEALTQAFRYRTEAKQFCAIGSIKSNVGHLVAAAGVTGLIKTALALYHKQIPPSLNYEAPNPEIDFANSPFYVNAKLIDWAVSETPRRAGVSSFGVGGTNAHVVLEEAPSVEVSSPSRPYQLLRLSAKTSEALEQTTKNLAKYLTQAIEVDLADVAYTLDQGRKAYNYRRFVVCRDRSEAIATLDSLDANRSATRLSELRDPDVVLMFPGQGSQYLNMGQHFYQHESVFRDEVDRCAEILQPLLNQDIRQIMYPSQENSETATALLRQTQYTQPALFVLEYALAKLWQSWGIHPAAMIGHSIGEFVAACMAGVFSLENGLKLIATRARMMGKLPEGSMLSVRLPAEKLEQRLTSDLAIAAINGPSLCVVSGPTDAIARLQHCLESEEVVCRPLHTSHAFHSPMMDSVIEPFAELIKTVQLSPPQIPFVSTVTADWITDDQATDPMYWATHLRSTVRFAEGVQTLWQRPERVLLEVGPRTTTATLARQQSKDLKRQVAISSLGSTADNNAECAAILQAIGQLWLAGVKIDRQMFYADEYRHRVPLPTYPFERKRYWIDPKPASDSTAARLTDRTQSFPIESPAEAPLPSTIQPTLIDSMPNSEMQTLVVSDTRKQQLIPQLQEVLEATSGMDISGADEKTTFLEMGLDSLSLTQVAMALKKKFKVKITFRHLLEDYSNLDTLADFVVRSLPPEALPASISAPSPTAATATSAVSAQPITPTIPATHMTETNSSNGFNGNGNVAAPLSVNPELAGTVQAVVAQQLQIMAQQLQLLGQSGSSGSGTSAIAPSIAQTVVPAALQPAIRMETSAPPAAAPAIDEPKPKKSFGPGAKIEKSISAALTPEQEKALDRIIDRYIAKTQESKRQTQEHRKYLADPRTVSGFTPLLKEMVYPIVTDRASGSKLWDVDGNEYVDITNGFGLNFFGWSPDFVTEAVKAQLDRGIEIGPQSPLAGKVAKLVAEFTGMERVAFCNTGSEAVMATLRLARTVTGRDLVATFAGDYHGTFDEVLYRQGANLKTLPAAPGILPSMFENLLVLDYNDPKSLEILRDRADDLAAILVEPVRSRDPGLQPKEFLQDLRRLTEQSGTAYIFDEVVTGFRVHPGGAQAYFDIQADMATYGKVVGGGLPIGIVAGKAEYMDALDGGFWQYGDSSIPEVGVTFFAGTFVRHPMALAAAEAVLLKLKAGGPELQRSLAEKVSKFATYLNQYFKQVGAPIEIAHFSSFFYINYPHELTHASLLFYLLREKGVHAWDHRPCFFTLSHSETDIELVIKAFKESVAEMQAIGFLPKAKGLSNGHSIEASDRGHPPQPDARLGRDPEGNPAWYIPDLERPGKYLQVSSIL